MAPPSTKTCTICGEVKPRSQFGRKGGRSKHDARRSYCNGPCRTLYNRAKQYGISIDEVRRLRESYCEICGRPPVLGTMVIDHCHATGKVRGALCSQCNVGLGMFGDDPDLLISAAEYLR